jgi:hypothetical protein
LFYRFKFDSHLSEIFKDAGLSASIFKIWPAGQTPIAVGSGKAMGWEPPEAARTCRILSHLRFRASTSRLSLYGDLNA